jgi:hypothetical protein
VQGKKDARLAKVEAENKVLRATAARLAKQKDDPAVEEIDDDDAEPPGLTLEQLKDAKKYWLGCGEAGKPEVARAEAQIALLQEASLAKKPGSEHVRFAERRVARAKKACEAGRDKLAALQQSIIECAEEKVAEDKELEEAEAAYQSAAKALQPEVEPGPKNLGGYQAMGACLPDEFFTQSGFTREQCTKMLTLLAEGTAAVEKQRKEADAAEASKLKAIEKEREDQKASGAAMQLELDNTKKELAKLQGQAAKEAADLLLARSADASASGGCDATDVDMLGELLQTEGLTDTVKRAMEAKFDLLNKRRRTKQAGS